MSNIEVTILIMGMTIVALFVALFKAGRTIDELRTEIARDFVYNFKERNMKMKPVVRLINLDIAGDQSCIDRKVQKLQDEGFDYWPDGCKNRLMAFRKYVPDEDEKTERKDIQQIIKEGDELREKLKKIQAQIQSLRPAECNDCKQRGKDYNQ